MRRMIDICVGIMLLILFSPLMIVIALAIVLESGPPAFYLPIVIGKDGKPFRFMRFRTMRDAPHTDASQRLTQVGRFIRNISLDHLPNLYNLVMGQVSLIGPRPTEPERVNLNDPDWQRILRIRPGILSYAVLTLAKDFNSASQAERNKLELEYLEKRSLIYDLQLLAMNLQKLTISGGNVKARGIPSKVMPHKKANRKGD